MFGSEEEYVMDFKAEDKKAQSVHYELENSISDCSTFSESEVDKHFSSVATPILFSKLKKPRVLIKKLPKEVLANYKTPVRSSTRIKSKHIPVGKYLALHRNIPLNEVINSKDKQRPNLLKPVKNTKLENKKYLSKKNNTVQNCNVKSGYKNKAAAVTAAPIVKNRNVLSSNNTRSLEEKIAATRILQKPREVSLPILPDVIITSYDMPPSPENHFVLNEASLTENVSSSFMSQNTFQNDEILAEPLITTYPNIYCPQNAESNVFPAILTPASSVKQSRHLVTPHAAARVSNDTLKHSIEHEHLANRKFTIQAFKMPDNSSKTKDPVPIAPAKVVVVNQSSLGIDSSKNNPNPKKHTIEKNPERQMDKENTADNGTEVHVDSDSDLEQTDVENETNSKVIKRIIYHTKAVQTKFTCNSSICGLVDSDEFNLNCFYCYDIFPLHKWLEFKEHIKAVHLVEERTLLLDSEIDHSDNDNHSRNRQENCSNINLSPIPRVKELTTKAVDTSQEIYKKLPLEPRLVAQRQNETFTEPCKIFSSTPKAPEPFRIAGQPQTVVASVKFNKNKIDQVISLDSEDDSDPIKGEGGQMVREVVEKKPQSKDTVVQVNYSKLTLPSLPHITIKKLEARVLPKENIDATRTAARPSASNKKVVKILSGGKKHKFIKVLPKPTAGQLSANNGTKPKYYVLKKLLKLPTTDEASKISQSDVGRAAATNNIKDSVPKPTKGLGIIFDSTKAMIVIEFLLKLKSFPELWRCQLKNNDPVKYNESVRKLCCHLNNRFDLNMTEFEMLLSIQRVRDWYYLMLRSMHEHDKDPNNTEPYKHKFPIYFKILSQYLTPDDDERCIQLKEILNKTAANVAGNQNEKSPQVNASETETQSAAEDSKPSKISRSSSTDTASSTRECSQKQDITDDGLIEFDADDMYDQESSDEKPPEEPKPARKKYTLSKFVTNPDGTVRRRTKVYLGRFECDICHKIFKRNCDVKRHKILHLPPQYECSECLQPFHYKHWAERCQHTVTKGYTKVDKASGEKRIWPKKIFRFSMICEICGNSYRSIGSLNTHKKDKHFNQRDKCIVCNFTALSNWRIVQHQRKRHIVEPGLLEDVAKKSRARTLTKTTFSNEARQAFDWRREMRKGMKPGEKFYGCCRCKIVFHTRKEKVLHNKTEHPITECTVLCLLCLPNKMFLSNAHGARRHYIDQHKVPWHEIDALVKCTKPIFDFLSNEEIELVKASENYKELLDELLKDKELRPVESLRILDEVAKAIHNLQEVTEQDSEINKDENVCVDGTTDNDNYSESNYNKPIRYASINEHDYSEEHVINDGFSDYDSLAGNNEEDDELYTHQPCEEETVHMNTELESNDCRVENFIQDEHVYDPNSVGDFVADDLIEESIVVEEYIDEIIGEDELELV